MESRAQEPQPEKPPDGPPWESPIAETPFALIDLEMTGLDPVTCRVIEICIQRERRGVVEDRIETLVNPGPDVSIPSSVHGIDASMLRDAPKFSDVADRVLALCDGAVLVAHGAACDVSFLNAEMGRIGRAPSFDFYIDTVPLARRAVLAGSHALGALAAHFGIRQSNPHRAGSDVEVLSGVFARLLAELKPKNARDLWHVRAGERQARPEVLNQCGRLAETGEMAEIGYRPSHKPVRRIVAIVREIRTDLDPPRVMGYALPDRGRFELRADRILWAIPRPSPKPDGKPT